MTHSLVSISKKQAPVLNRLHELMIEAIAVAEAIRDNAQDDNDPIPLELIFSFNRDYDKIVSALSEAA